MLVTYSDAAAVPLPDALMRWQQLDRRDRVAGADGEDAPPLIVAKYLELLALGEVLARHFRPPSIVCRALTAGATWQQVADATGCTTGEALAAYLRWTDRRRQTVTTGPAACAAPKPGDVS